MSSIFESFKVYQLDQVHFSTGWLLVEEKFRYHKSCKILSMIQMSKFDSFSQIVQLITIMLEMTFDDIFQMLSVHGPRPYEAFKNDWCMKKIQAYVPSVDVINQSYFKDLFRNSVQDLMLSLFANCSIPSNR